MASSFNLRKAQQEIKRDTAHIRLDPRPNAELAERDHLHELFLRLVPAVYEYPGLSIEDLLHGVALKLNAAEAQYLADRLYGVRKKRHLAVVSRGDEGVLLPLRPDFDPRLLPLSAIWADGGFYTAKERDQSNSSKLRRLGLRDGIVGYVSYRVLVLNPPLGRPGWQTEPQEISVHSSYEAEAVAAELAVASLIERLETERNLPAADQFHLVLFSDCQSLIAALKNPGAPEKAARKERRAKKEEQAESGEPPKEEAAAVVLARLRELTGLFAGFYPQWEMRRRIKQRLGH